MKMLIGIRKRIIEIGLCPSINLSSANDLDIVTVSGSIGALLDTFFPCIQFKLTSAWNKTCSPKTCDNGSNK